jgi:hypothetical protein
MGGHAPRPRRRSGSIMLKGSKSAVVKKIQPVSIHGQISLDVYVCDPDDPQGQVTRARIGPEAVPRNLEPGDPVELHYLLGVVTQITRRA